MEERVLDQQMADFLVYKKRYGEAADIYLSEGNKVRALELLLDPEWEQGAVRGHQLLINELWELFPIQCEEEVPSAGSEFLTMASSLKITSSIRDEVNTSLLIAQSCHPDFDQATGHEARPPVN